MRAVIHSDARPGVLVPWAVVVAAWAGATGVLVAGAVAGSQATVLLAAGLLPFAAAVTVALSPRLGIRLPEWTDTEGGHRYAFETPWRAAAGTLLHAPAWLLFAWQAYDGDGAARFPGPGEAALVLQVLALAGGVLSSTVLVDGGRRLRIAFDATLGALGLDLALWTLLPDRWAQGGTATPFAVTLCFGLLLQVVLVGLLVVREPVTRGWGSVLAVGLLTTGAVCAVVTGHLGERGLPWPVSAGWVVGWVAMTLSVLYNRPVPALLVSPDLAERREVRSTDVATALVVGAVFVAVIDAWIEQTEPWMPGGSPGAVALLVAATVFAARETVLGRARALLTSQLRRQAELDPLTGLENRRGLTARLGRIPPDAEWSVLALDLDGFKGVNDVHGHAAGDRVLVVVGEVLHELCPPAGVAARTGGDEFAVLVPGDLVAGRMLGARIAAAVRERLASLGLGPRITVSVGVGRVGPDRPATVRAGADASPRRGEDRLAAVVEAAAALRSAKELGRDRVQVYPGAVARQRERSLLVEARLREALAQGRLTSAGQPIVDLRTGAPVAVEALARWDDEVLGRVPPSEFVVVAERTGLVGELGRAVLQKSAEAFARNGFAASGLRLAVNASPLELRLPDYVESFARTLESTGVPAWAVVVEVTEAVVVEEDDPAVLVLARLGDLGVQVAIDDFGTGYSALGYLRRLPVQSMKVDRSLVTESLTSVRTRHIVAGVVDLAKRLGLGVTLEGIEDAAAARLAHELGAQHGQGYALGAPTPWDELAGRLRTVSRPGGAASPGRPGAVAG